jgi:hypothetical protein
LDAVNALRDARLVIDQSGYFWDHQEALEAAGLSE